jgi:hypothetical protein
MTEDKFRFGFAQASPYRYYYGAVSPLKGLEVDGRLTEVLDVPAPGMPQYGDYKDKAIDIKYRFLPEGKWWPAIAVGIMDPSGTRLYSSQYIVASKQLYPFDFTIGFGNGRYGKKPLPQTGHDFKLEMFSDNASWRSDGQFFGGIQFALTKNIILMAEYSPIQYQNQTNDPAQPKYFTEAVPSKFNFGIRWKPWSWLETDLSCQRGNQVGVNVSAGFDLGTPLIPIYDASYKEKPDLRLNPLEERITEALYKSGFSDIGIMSIGEELWIDASNDKYYYNMKALGVALRILSQIVPKDIRKIHLILTENGIPIWEFAVETEDLKAFYAEQLTVDEFFYVSNIRTDVWETPNSRKMHWSYFDYGLKPDFRMFLNDPSGFFKYRFGMAGQVFLNPWKGTTFAAGVGGYPINTISSANAPLSTPVRTDLVLYQQQKAELEMLLVNQMRKFGHEIYGRVAAGYLEQEYAGLDAEVAMPLAGGRIFAGLSGSVVKKRDPDVVFELKENDWKDHYVTGFFNLRLNIPEIEVYVDLKNGQFLAGDRGTVITVSKDFNGVVLSAWYSITDTSVFTDSYNKGYHDTGITVTIPIRMFIGKDSKTAYDFGISPWTRDVAQDIDHFDKLFDFIGRNTNVYIDKDKRMIQ